MTMVLSSAAAHVILSSTTSETMERSGEITEGDLRKILVA